MLIFLFQLIFGRKKSKTGEESSSDSNKVVHNQQIDDKLYEYVNLQNDLAEQYSSTLPSGSSNDESSSDESESQPHFGAEHVDIVEDEHNRSGIASEESKDSGHGNTTDNDDSNDSDDDDAFNDLLNQHFERTTAQPTIVSAQTDSFPCLDVEPIDKEVKFSIDKCRAAPCADYDGTEYRIGFLDLTANECARMHMISQTDVYLTFQSNYIVIRDNKFNIKRITEREISPNVQTYDSMYDELKLCRVQFSSTEPFFAKYENEIYFVGDELYNEYSELLKHSKKCAGTAIRIGHDRLIIDYSKQTLNLKNSIPFRNQKEICVIKGSFDKYKFQDEYPLTGYQRFMICDKPWTLLEIEPELLHSSIYDDCTEIYADVDYPFDDSDSANVEKIVKPSKVTKKPKKNVPRYLEEE